MPELTSSQIERLENAMESIMVVKTVLLGVNGDKGLVGKVEESCINIKSMDENLDKLDTRVTKIEVKSGLIAGFISVATAIGSWFANKG